MENEIQTEQSLSVEQETEQTEQTKTFTQEDLNRVATKEAKKTEQAILKQFGLDKKEDLTSTLEEFNAFREAKKNQETDSDKLAKLTSDFETLNTNYQNANNELSQIKQNSLLKSKGVDDKSLKFYRFEVTELAKEKDIEFSEALDQYLTENPIEEKAVPPSFFIKDGKKGTTPPKIDMNNIIRGKK